jgi:hypothetical protein
VTTDAEVAAALLILRRRIQEMADPLELGSLVAQVGEFTLERLGFEMDAAAEAKIDIGTDEYPDHARITLVWPLPAGAFVDESPLAGVNEKWERT